MYCISCHLVVLISFYSHVSWFYSVFILFVCHPVVFACVNHFELPVFEMCLIRAIITVHLQGVAPDR